MAKAEKTADPTKNEAANAANGLDWEFPTEWKEVLTGFPPYWNAEEGAKFMGMVMGKDEKDEKFVRYLVRATRPVKCFRGPTDEQEEMIVMPGEYFTLSEYINLNLDPYVNMGELAVLCKGKIKAKTPTGFVWGFMVRMSPQTERLLEERDRQNPLMSQQEREPVHEVAS